MRFVVVDAFFIGIGTLLYIATSIIEDLTKILVARKPEVCHVAAITLLFFLSQSYTHRDRGRGQIY